MKFCRAIFVKSDRVAVSTCKLFITLQIYQTCQQVSQYDGKLQVVQHFESLLRLILLILVQELISCISRNWIILNQVVLLKRRFVSRHLIYWQENQIICIFRKLDFLSQLEYHSNCEKYPSLSRCFRAHRALLNHLYRRGKKLWCHDVTHMDFRGAR